ncbi:MAG: ADP-forming succinate--CoA ligase subunit beta, partial [Acidimicrobiales bacterium]
KAQVHVGGRGKAGGVRVAGDGDEARRAASDILGMSITGHVVRAVLVERASDIAAEYYASFTLDRSAKLHLGLLSARGGVDIEQVAAEAPAAIARLHVDPVDGLSDEECRAWVARAGLAPEAEDGVAALVGRLYRCYVDGDADLVEVNPLVLTGGGDVVALDAKVTLDDNAAFRHPEWEEFLGTEVVDDRERLAREKGLQYVGLDGTVGIIANGAGLAMSTLDVVNQVGGEAANFLDIGGGASAAVMANALEVISTDDNVRAILVNIFGGITRGEEVANGIVEALGRVELVAPLVVRLDGTNAAEGRAILAGHESDRLISRATMLDAARTAVELAAAGAGGGEG